jgi:lysophospholipase L1-like esterase
MEAHQNPRFRPGFVIRASAAAAAIGLAAFWTLLLCAAALIAPDQNHLDHYAAADQALEASGARPDVVFIGDSITHQWPKVGQAAWDCRWLDRGIGGERSDQVRARFAQDALALRPRAVVILVGTNDAWVNNPALPLAMTEANVAAMVTLARAAGVRVLIASVTPFAKQTRPPLGPVPPHAEARIEAQNGWMRDYAARSGAGFIDYWRAMRPELTIDGVHPTAAGYALMAREAERALAS